ncbi:penicillin-binding protein 2 [Effusibacillus pohliae]|uniref:penicillin-binding protein 2 n=1 Tax=Effusibacillus pohliae TaxID=232270 RepID=UPI00037BA024|nr:penicillin-binding protein 2 [Effusibacillus pohliae]
MQKENQSQHSARLHSLFMILFIGLVLLLLRLSYIQLGKGKDYAAMAEANRYVQQVLPAPRGQFLDRNGEILVTNKPSFTIQFTNSDEQVEKQIPAIAERLVQLLNDPNDKEKISKDEMIAIMQGKKDNLPKSTPRKVKVNATELQVARVKEHLNELPGITVIPEALRDYRYKTFASHVFGYLNSIKPEMWKEYKDKGYRMTDRVGYTGLEKQYEDYLRGKDGATRVEVNIYGDPVHRGGSAEFIEKPVPGDDLVLTLDKKLQQVTEQALAERVNALKGRGVKHAAAVAMDPNTGEVLAMASYPPFDPNHWLNGISDENYKLFQQAEWNYAAEYPIEPGSTVKMLSVLMGIKEGVIRPNELIWCGGSLNIASYRAGDWNPGGHGSIDGKKAIAESCDVYMYTIGMRLAKTNLLSQMSVGTWAQKYDLPAIEKLKQYQHEFGLGVKTGIDLPFEDVGRYNYAKDTAVNLPFMLIGQNEAFTPLQIAQYVSTIANNGKRMKPYLVKQIKDPNGKIVKETQPEVLNTVSFPAELLQYVRDGMRDVTHAPYGTASYTFGNKPYDVAGKTGTSETGRGTENYWFVGFAPYNNPKIVVSTVVIDGPLNAHSYEMAGPIAEKMLDAYFNVETKPDQKKPTSAPQE